MAGDASAGGLHLREPQFACLVHSRLGSLLRQRRIDEREYLTPDTAIAFVRDNFRCSLFQQGVIRTPARQVSRLSQQIAEFFGFMEIVTEGRIHFPE
jgi:hypothetical protein